MTGALIRSLFTCPGQTAGNCCPVFWVNSYQDFHLCYICAWKGTNNNYWSLQRSSLSDGSFSLIFKHIPQFSPSSKKDLNDSAEGQKKPGGGFQTNNFLIYWSSILTHIHFSLSPSLNSKLNHEIHSESYSCERILDIWGLWYEKKYFTIFSKIESGGDSEDSVQSSFLQPLWGESSPKSCGNYTQLLQTGT